MTRLYPRGTRLADVPPNFRGVSYVQWLFSALADAPRTMTGVSLADKPVSTGRSDYGMGGVRGSYRRHDERVAAGQGELIR